MNFDRMEAALRSIRANSEALEWLEEYGAQITGEEPDTYFEFNFRFAHGKPGASAAARFIEKYARRALPMLVQQAVENCRNTIAMDRAAISEEMGE